MGKASSKDGKLIVRDGKEKKRRPVKKGNGRPVNPRHNPCRQTGSGANTLDKMQSGTEVAQKKEEEAMQQPVVNTPKDNKVKDGRVTNDDSTKEKETNVVQKEASKEDGAAPISGRLWCPMRPTNCRGCCTTTKHTRDWFSTYVDQRS